MNYTFDADVAMEFGVNEAVLIHNLQFWVLRNRANNKHTYEGRVWTYNSVSAFADLFPFWTARQIRTILDKLIAKKVIMKGRFNSTHYDRTCWYCFTEEDKWIRPKAQIDLTETSNRNVQIDQPIPDSKTDSNTDIKESNKEKLPTPKIKKTKEIKKRTKLNEKFRPTKLHYILSKEKGYANPDDEVEGFIDYHIAKGTLNYDWDRAFNTWLRVGTKFSQQNSTRSKTTTEQFYDSIPDAAYPDFGDGT